MSCRELPVIPVGEPQHRFLGFCCKVIPSLVKICTSFEQKFLQTLIEIGYVTMRLQVNLQPEMVILSWVLSDPANDKLGGLSSNLKWKWQI